MLFSIENIVKTVFNTRDEGVELSKHSNYKSYLFSFLSCINFIP